MSKRTEPLDSPQAHEAVSQVPGTGNELSRLRHSGALNSEIVASLRAQREQDLQHNGEQAALLAAVAEQLQSHWSAFSEQISSANVSGLATEAATELLRDLLDYTRIWAGTLSLEREPVHLGRLVREAVAQAAATRGMCGVPATVQIQPDVPERVLADASRLSKVLMQVVGAALDVGNRDAPSLLIQIDSAGVGDLAIVPDCLEFVVEVPMSLVARPTEYGTMNTAGALRAALVERLCEYMDGSLRDEATPAGSRCWHLILPLEASQDPVQAGELERAGANPAAPQITGPGIKPIGARAAGEAGPAAEGAIDYMYLDRQLGSLAQLVLARTAPAFLFLAEERLTTLVVAQQMADRDRIRDLAQAWKASAMSVGGRALAGLLGSVEKQAAAGHVPGEGAMRQIRSALELLQRALVEIGPEPGQSR